MNDWQVARKLHQIAEHTGPNRTVIVPDDRSATIENCQGLFAVASNTIIAMPGVDKNELRSAADGEIHKVVG